MGSNHQSPPIDLHEVKRVLRRQREAFEGLKRLGARPGRLPSSGLAAKDPQSAAQKREDQQYRQDLTEDFQVLVLLSEVCDANADDVIYDHNFP
jgi:hypothetical protein